MVFLGTNKVTVKKKISDTEGKFLELEVEIASENVETYAVQTRNPNKLKLLKNCFRT